MSVAYGKSGNEAGPGGQIIPAKKLEEIAGNQNLEKISYNAINNL
jgi:hypothetical protein